MIKKIIETVEHCVFRNFAQCSKKSFDPALCIGQICECFKQSGKIPSVKDRPTKYETGYAWILAQSFRTLAGILSKPVALITSRICNKLNAYIGTIEKIN